MEDIEDSDGSKDEVQLGRLHFSMDYDFTKSEVVSKASLIVGWLLHIKRTVNAQLSA